MPIYTPSISFLLSGVFVAYIIHSMWSMSQLFVQIKCSTTPCYTYLLDDQPKFQLALFTSVTSNPINSEVTKIYSNKNFNYRRRFRKNFEINVPLQTRRNGTMYLQVVFALAGEPLEWRTLRRDGPTIIHNARLTDYVVPEAEAFNLLSDSTPEESKQKKKYKSKLMSAEKPFTHIMSNVHITLLTDSFSLSQEDVPPEMARLIHVNHHHQILPILKTDFFNTRMKDLVKVTKNTTESTLTFNYNPIGIGKLRLMLMTEIAMNSVQAMGFSKKDIDEVKGIFSDTNVYLLCGTVFIASIHLLFDCLSFKNDITFWREKESYEGLSTRATLWRAFSQSVIFLYLLDERTSALVLIPAGISVIIELWKCKKILRLEIGSFGLRKIQSAAQQQEDINEKKTEEFDKEGMRYLSYLLYPLCICGAIYSLIYQPHRSWYSWTLKSLVNGVYCFGFLFMLPQLFVNYKLKSVAALPWRAFMYKAFNTFIDDFFAFIITMPTAHRIACLRDDVVFIIYLWQRYLYPVDKNRSDDSLAIEKSTKTEKSKNSEQKQKKEKKEKKKNK